ncbi:adenylate/guanylate cyclase domain-containing protein [Desulfobacterales bacterium HSG16]|nr:adenylate/guanylate cyclase domain-containing protein [Desulfobacterales bacterium HSG16]
MNHSQKQKPRILVIDDSPINIRVLVDSLMSEYEISVATNGKDALNITASENPPDLILLDIMMPEMDGYEVCGRLNADERTRRIPVIFITARNREDDETRGLELGAVDYITKPFCAAIAKARIKTHLELKKYRDDLERSVRERTDELIRVNIQLQDDIMERKKAEESLKQAKEEEVRLLEMATALSFELNLTRLLGKIMDTTKQLLSADRCTLFLIDEKKGELWSQVAHGLEIQEIRFPCHLGIAGSVYIKGETINIPDAYADDRFNPDVDRKTGYKTESILCMPVKNKKSKTIGVVQILNKRGGPFSHDDEVRLKAFSAQASIALENAKLFEDVNNMRNYNESVLESMSNGMIAFDADTKIVKYNSASLRIFNIQPVNSGVNGKALHKLQTMISELNPWIAESIDRVLKTGEVDIEMDVDLDVGIDVFVSVNMTIVPLKSIQKEIIGSLIVLEDITSEKRLRGTISRYMTKEVADKLLGAEETVLGGQIHEATILFSDIRDFTTISERIGPQETVTLLNEYFTLAVDVIFKYKGILDKYIGDAILAVFGAPFSSGDDPDRAVKTAIDILLDMGEFNERRIAESKDPIKIGIGINTNEILSGNIGSLKRMDYTVIGDGVNLASRLEGANKVYGTQILISEFTYKKLKGDYLSREVDLIRVKGKTRPVGIYQIMVYSGQDEYFKMEQLLELFQKGFNCYRNREWKKGIDYFARAVEIDPHDRASSLYIERSYYFDEHPPPELWDNIWDMKEK